MAKRLTSSQKLKNAKTYKLIREGYSRLVKSNPETDITYKQFKKKVISTNQTVKESIKSVFSQENVLDAREYNVVKSGYSRLVKSNPETDITYKQFKNRVLAMRKATGDSLKIATQKTMNTEDFVSPAERSRTNLLNALRTEYNAAYQKIVSLTRDPKGRFISKEKLRSKLIWTTYGKKRGYKFEGGDGKEYFIDVDPSPKGVYIIEIRE